MGSKNELDGVFLFSLFKQFWAQVRQCVKGPVCVKMFSVR